MKSYTIHLIRHGLTQGNEEGRYIGSTDLPLSDSGKARLRALLARKPYPQAQVYFTSPLKRCVQTLNLLYPQAQPVVVDGLRECDFGAWEGKTAKEIAGADPMFARWIAGGGNGSITPPGGESGGAFAQRVCASFEKLVEGMMRSGTESAVIVTHGGAIMSILAAYGLPKAQFYDWMTESGCGYSMRIMPGLWMRSMVGEVYAKLPGEAVPDDGVMLIDLAREAAERAYGKKDDEKKP